MLIDIQKYVRQILPPDRRLPKHIGLATLLFSPINSIIDSFNDFVYNSQFDTGTPGQVAVLEFILRNAVHPNIKVLSADGARIDFRVLVPEGLSLGQKGEVTRLVERYRLRSKRYEITDSIDWGSGESDPVTGLKFSTLPNIIVQDGVFLLEYGVNLSGVYPTKIFHLESGDVYLSGNLEYIGGAKWIRTLPKGGVWGVQIASLYKTTANVGDIVTVTEPPVWLTKLGLTNSINTKEVSLWLHASTDTKLRIESVDGTPITGLSWNNVPWSNTSYVDGTTDWVIAPWSEVFRLNQAAGGVGGLTPGKSYRIYIVRASNPSPVYTKVIAIPTTENVGTPVELALSDAPDLEPCPVGPLINSMISMTSRRVIWNMHAAEVTRLKCHAKDAVTDEILATKELQVSNNVNGSYVPVFSPGYRIILDWDTPLAPGSVKFGTEGANCSSEIDWSDAFTIVEEGDPGPDPDPDPDPDPQLGDYVAKYMTRCWPGHLKISYTLTEDGKGIIWQDLITLDPPPGYYVGYVVNQSHIIPAARLTGQVLHFPAALSVRKGFIKNGITSLESQGNGSEHTDYIYPLSFNTSFAQVDIVFIKQAS
jgi:hypothetical protein